MIGAPIVLAGAAVGLGVTVIAAGLRPPPPDLPAAMARLDASTPAPPPPAGSADRRSGPADRFAARWSGRAGTDLARTLGLGTFAADLRLLGESVDVLLVRKAGYGLLGLAFPPTLTAAMAVLGLRLPWTIPALAALVFAAVLFFIPDLDLRRRAGAARAELRQAVCAYLELVALERAADAGAVEALERAATIADSPGFTRIRDALTRAQLAGLPPWQGLSELAAATGVEELADVADIMRISGTDGAAVYATLRARAASLRTALMTQASAAANAASEHMVAPVAALGLAFMALLGYPAFARIVFGT